MELVDDYRPPTDEYKRGWIDGWKTAIEDCAKQEGQDVSWFIFPKNLIEAAEEAWANVG